MKYKIENIIKHSLIWVNFCDIANLKLLVFIPIFFLVSLNVSISQNTIQKEIYLDRKPTNVIISNFRNSSYISHSELSRILNLKTEQKDGRLIQKSSMFQITFLRGSSFMVIKHSGKEHIKQLHLPVVEINKIIYLPFPTSLTLLDTAGLIDIVIDKHHNISKNKQLATNEIIHTIEDLEIPENIEQITKVHNKLKNRPVNTVNPKQEIIQPNKTNNQLKTTKKSDKIIHEGHQEAKITTSTESNQTHKKEIVKRNNILENPEPTIINNIQDNELQQIKSDSNEQKYNGYKIPKDLKRKRLQKLLGQNDI